MTRHILEEQVYKIMFLHNRPEAISKEKVSFNALETRYRLNKDVLCKKYKGKLLFKNDCESELA